MAGISGSSNQICLRDPKIPFLSDTERLICSLSDESETELFLFSVRVAARLIFPKVPENTSSNVVHADMNS